MPFHICSEEVAALLAIVPGAVLVWRRIAVPTFQWVRGKLWG